MQKKKKKRKYLLYTVAMKIKWVTEGTSSLPIVWLLPLCQIKGKKELTSLYNAPAKTEPFQQSSQWQTLVPSRFQVQFNKYC